jgi:hypothetical protein
MNKGFIAISLLSIAATVPSFAHHGYIHIDRSSIIAF